MPYHISDMIPVALPQHRAVFSISLWARFLLVVVYIFTIAPRGRLCPNINVNGAIC